MMGDGVAFANGLCDSGLVVEMAGYQLDVLCQTEGCLQLPWATLDTSKSKLGNQISPS